MTDASTTTITPEGMAYLHAVRAELSDLPEDERADLLEDLSLHLAELLANAEEDSLEHLGPPTLYAAELRAAAGLRPRTDAAPSGAKRRSARLPSIDLVRVRAVWDSLRAVAQSQAVATLRVAGEPLFIGWWVARGYLAVLLVAVIHADRNDDFPVPTAGGSHLGGIAVVGGVVAVSIWLGRRRPGRLTRNLNRVANAAVLISLAFTAVGRYEDNAHQRPVFYTNVSTNVQGLQTQHGLVTNIYPYSRDGQPLNDVLLFDQDGRPLRTLSQQWWADGCPRVVAPPLAHDGVPVDFSYPHTYLVAGPPQTTTCTATVAAPPVPLPTFAPDKQSTTTTTAPAASP
jgi:hypothetical protein